MKKHDAHKIKKALEKLDLRAPRLAKRVRTIKAHYNTWVEWKQDKVGYWLFRVDHKHKDIHAGFCRKNNMIEVVVVGDDGEEMYNTIVREGLVKSLQHAAYIGYELHKAEVALRLGLKYVQDSQLQFVGKR